MNNREEELLRWWKLSLDGDGEAHMPILTYAIGTLPSIEFADKTVNALAERLHKCRAQSPMQLRQWCYRQINRLAESLNVKRGTEKIKRSGEKLFVYETDGENIAVKLYYKGEQHIWRFPAWWVEAAKLLWPVHLRKSLDGTLFVARKTPIINPDFTRSQRITQVRRLFLGLSAVRRSTSDAAECEVLDGDWLNWTDGNLRLIRGSDALDHAEVSISGIEETFDTDLEPKGPIAGRSGWHDRSVLRLFHPKHAELSPTLGAGWGNGEENNKMDQLLAELYELVLDAETAEEETLLRDVINAYPALLKSENL